MVGDGVPAAPRGAFARVERWTPVGDPAGSRWRTISAGNVATWYGRTAHSRIADPRASTRVYSWLASERYDDRGNAMTFAYIPDNGDGVDPTAAHERNRDAATRGANRHLKRIRYGNRTPYPPTGALPDDDWCFEVVLDYGEHDEAPPLPGTAVRPWPCRPDPVSTYRPGFELRTYRLCRRILVFHHFPEVAAVGRDCLVSSLDLDHTDPSAADPTRPPYALLRSVTRAGYRREGAGYLRRAYPPVEFDWSRPRPDPAPRELAAGYQPGGPDGGYQLVDLDGDGAAGVLTGGPDAGWWFQPNLSPVTIGADGAVPVLDRADPRLRLVDLTGDGRADLLLDGRTRRSATMSAIWSSSVPGSGGRCGRCNRRTLMRISVG